MQHGLLPDAPVCHDISSMSKAWLHSHGVRRLPIAVVAGFPCIGFSTAGRRQGFDNEQSSLFFEMLRVIDDLTDDRGAPILFLENVANIITLGMVTIWRELCIKRRYSLRWCTMAASMIGAPQLRERWYCIAAPSRFDETVLSRCAPILKPLPYDWDKLQPRPNKRMMLHQTPEDVLASGLGRAGRVALLGNSVVPSAASHAFWWLLAARWAHSCTPVPSPVHRWPRCGTIMGRRVSSCESVPAKAGCPKDYGIVLDPRAYVQQANKALLRKINSTLLSHHVRRALWGTLTRSDYSNGANALTERSSKKIMAQVRFARDTPARLRNGVMTAEFAEWVMGYPAGWTLVTPGHAAVLPR